MTDKTPRLTLDVAHWAKGLPPGLGEIDLAEIPRLGLDVLAGDLPLPVALLKTSALENNRAFMRRFLAATGVKLAPHGKTTMAPALFQMQLDDGAWGMTAATAAQVVVFRRFGVPRIILANELVGRANIDVVLAEIAADPGFDFYCLVDHPDGLAELVARARCRSAGRPVQVLVEVGGRGARTGVRTHAEGHALARAAKAAEPFVSLRGVEAYEGVFSGPDAEQARKISELMDMATGLADTCRRERLFGPGPVILSAGGSAWFDLVAKGLAGPGSPDDTTVVIRSGCTLTHDDLSYAKGFERLIERSPEIEPLGRLQPAIEVWGMVQSRPEPGLAYANVGKRDISYDVDMPVPRSFVRAGLHDRPQPLSPDHKVLKLNDQHAHLRIPEASPLAVGDLIASGISHPCTTFDKWKVMLLVDDDYRVTGAIRTYF